MRSLLLLSILFVAFHTLSAQAVHRLSDISPLFDVVVDPGPCTDRQCGPITVGLYRKHSNTAFQTVSAGTLSKSDIDTPVQFVDVDFDGRKDLLVFDGYTYPGGNSTSSYRIYLYSVSKHQFVFDAGLSRLSREEDFLFDRQAARSKHLVTYARLGAGVFQNRWYRLVNGEPKMVKEIISDAQYDNGHRTLETTRTLVRNRWIVHKRKVKTDFNL